MIFSKEKFIRGFNVEVGTYYRLWNIARDGMLEDDICLRNFQTDKNADWDIWPLFEKVYIDEDFTIVINISYYGKWAFDQVWGMTYAAKKYVKENKAQFENNECWPSRSGHGDSSDVPLADTLTR